MAVMLQCSAVHKHVLFVSLRMSSHDWREGDPCFDDV